MSRLTRPLPLPAVQTSVSLAYPGYVQTRTVRDFRGVPFHHTFSKESVTIFTYVVSNDSLFEYSCKGMVHFRYRVE